MANVLLLGILGLLFVGLLQAFFPGLRGGTVEIVVSAAGVVLFALFTAFDLQRIAAMGRAGANPFLLALSLYLDIFNLFLYVLGNGFLCGGAAMMLTIAAATLTMAALSPYTWQSIQHNYLIAAPIIMLTEAFTTGMLITAFTVFQPQAVLNFSDEEYIIGK